MNVKLNFFQINKSNTKIAIDYYYNSTFLEFLDIFCRIAFKDFKD